MYNFSRIVRELAEQNRSYFTRPGTAGNALPLRELLPLACRFAEAQGMVWA